MWTILVLYAPLLALLYGISVVVYRLTIHPLAKFPGPKLTAATKWWEFYLDIVKGERGGFMYEVDRMHEQYGVFIFSSETQTFTEQCLHEDDSGHRNADLECIQGPVVRINPNEIHVSDPQWLDTLYPGPGPRRDKYPPSAHMSGVPQGTFGTIDHYMHRQRRSAVKTFVSKRSVRTVQANIQSVVNNLCTRFSAYARAHEVVDISLPYIAWSTDSVSNYLENEPFGLLQDDVRAQKWKDTIKTVVELAPLVKQIPIVMPLVLKVPAWLMNLVSPELALVLVMHNRMGDSATDAYIARELIKEKGLDPATTTPTSTESSTLQTNAYTSILESTLPEPDKQPPRLAQEILTLLVGGSATSARIMTRLTYHLISEPAMLKRLKEELLGVMPRLDSPTPALEDLEKLPFLTSVIKESLRIATAVRSRLPLISPDKPLIYKDWVIPAGTPTSMTPASVITDPSIYRDPSVFNPDRWLGDAEEVASLNKYFVPFGRGARMCIGMNFAWAEIYLCTATVFRHFDFQPMDVDRARDVDVVRDCFLGEPCLGSKGVRVQVKELEK